MNWIDEVAVKLKTIGSWHYGHMILHLQKKLNIAKRQGNGKNIEGIGRCYQCCILLYAMTKRVKQRI